MPAGASGTGPARPLAGRKILVTREDQGEDRFSAAFAQAGAEVYKVALTRTIPPEDRAALAAAVRDLRRYNWVVFTSARAVEATAAAWKSVGGAGGPAGEAGVDRFPVPVACVGPATAGAVSARLLRDPDLVPERFDAASLAEALSAASGPQRPAPGGAGAVRRRSLRVLFPAAENARPELPSALRSAGFEVEQVIAYRTIADPPPPERLLPPQGGRWDAVVFTSGMVVQVFVEALRRSMGRAESREWLAACRPAALGRSAEEALAREGIAPAARAARPVPEDLVQAVVRALARPEGRG